MRTPNLLSAMVIIATVLCLVACCCPPDDTDSPLSSPSGRETPPSQPDLEVTSVTSQAGEFGIRYITGVVVNNTARTYSYVQISFNLYDASGAQVGSTMDNINNLEPGGIWKFKALITEERTAKYKLKDVTGF